MIHPRNDRKDGFCRVADTTTLLSYKHVSPLILSSSDKFLKNMWLATTSRTLQIPRSYFSKRVGGFFIPTPERAYDESFGFYSLYGSSASSEGYIMSCPLLPLKNHGGFVGVVTIEVDIPHRGGYTGYGLVVFGFPPSLKKPFAGASVEFVKHGDRNSQPMDDFVRDPLGYGLRKWVEWEHGGFNKLYQSCSYDWYRYRISTGVDAVFHTGMVFTQLNIEIDSDFSSFSYM